MASVFWIYWESVMSRFVILTRIFWLLSLKYENFSRVFLQNVPLEDNRLDCNHPGLIRKLAMWTVFDKTRMSRLVRFILGAWTILICYSCVGELLLASFSWKLFFLKTTRWIGVIQWPFGDLEVKPGWRIRVVSFHTLVSECLDL